jgi:type II secretory ATPase GspE/PulE/Tfp pilus assembly ATPase PilB-like protein
VISSGFNLSAWQQLRDREITCEQALTLLVDDQGNLNLTLLDPEVSQRFFRGFSDRKLLPPMIPLLLWQSCYYLGTPVTIAEEILNNLRQRTLMDIKVVPISEKSYRTWYHSTRLDPTSITSERLINPLTGEVDKEDISEVTELFLAKAVDQIARIKTIISGALRNRASDIHLEPGAEGLLVRYRIDGVLRNITTLPKELSRRVTVAIKVMSDMDISESRRPQDGRIGENYKAGSETSNVGLDMRVSTLPCMGGEKTVIRLLPQQNPFESLNDLGFTPEALEIYKLWLHQPQGMIIFTGPTGSGKTSTLYTSLQAIATEAVNVVTVEDPVEYVLPRINQTQVNERAGMTFAAGLRAILRQDPDIIMVGEVRDKETAETAVRAALTGHLVLTTLHTNDAVSTIPRLKDIGPDPGLISDALLGVVAQRLVRRVCPHCTIPYLPPPDEVKLLKLKPEETETDQWRMGKGCNQCFESGYLGRVAVVELLDVDDRVRDLVYQGTTTQLHAYLRQRGYISFRKAAIAKVTQGLTTLSEVLRVLPRSALDRD